MSSVEMWPLLRLSRSRSTIALCVMPLVICVTWDTTLMPVCLLDLLGSTPILMESFCIDVGCTVRCR